MVNESTSSYGVSVEEPVGDACGGTVIVIAKFYHLFASISVLKSFIFNAFDFIIEEESVEKEDFYNSMVEEGIEIEHANIILINLILIADEVINSNEYSPSKIVTLSLTLNIRHDVSYEDHWEQQAIQESFDSWNVIPKPTTQEAIISFERQTFTEKTNNEEVQKMCVICLQEFVKEQEVMKLPCGHEFDVVCLLMWLETHYKFPCCRFKLPS